MDQNLSFREIATLAAVIAVTVVLALVVRGLVSRRPTAAAPARHILDERYAKGDVDRDEHEQKRRDLGR